MHNASIKHCTGDQQDEYCDRSGSPPQSYYAFYGYCCI